MYKNIILGVIAASLLTIAVSTIYIVASLATLSTQIEGIKMQVENNDPMKVIAKWEEMKKAAHGEQPKVSQNYDEPVYSSGKGPIKVRQLN